MQRFTRIVPMLLLLLAVFGYIPASAQEADPAGCFDNLTQTGTVTIDAQGGCQMTVRFPTTSGSTANLTFTVNTSRFDIERDVRLVICRSRTNVTLETGFRIASAEIQSDVRYGGQEVQLGTVSSGGQDCMVHFPTSKRTVWTVSMIGNPDSLLTIAVGGMDTTVQPMAETGCFTNWQVSGEVFVSPLGDCLMTVQFNDSTESPRAVSFRVDTSRFDTGYDYRLIICRSRTSITPGDGYRIASSELPRRLLSGNQREVQLGTASSGGKDCLVHTPTGIDTDWIVQQIGTPEGNVVMEVIGVPLQ